MVLSELNWERDGQEASVEARPMQASVRSGSEWAKVQMKPRLPP